MTKDVFAGLVALIMLSASSRYAYQVRKREINPAPSTWIIFIVGTGLSLTTYAIAENRDFRSGILNTIDVVSVLIVLTAIAAWGKREVRFEPFEKWWLGGIAAIVAYGIASGDAWKSNVFTQFLIAIGYAPTLHKLLVKKRNTESFTAWGLGLLAASVALYPAFVDGNALAALYAIRTIVMITVILSIMAYFESRSGQWM